jgi:molecular chaperone DnaK
LHKPNIAKARGTRAENDPGRSVAAPRLRITVGIDLGTTNSVVALLDPTTGSLITGQDNRGRQTLSSAIGCTPDGALLVGQDALESDTRGQQALSSIKRFMGRETPLAVGTRTFTPPQASAEILRRLHKQLAEHLQHTKASYSFLLDSAIITMPAYFNHDQIEATRLAGTCAGFDVVELLHEPTAAAMYYAWLHDHDQANYLVYDLGGGTFDVSIIRRRLDDYEVLGVSGDPFLGGDDFDRLLATHLVETGTWRWLREDGSSETANRSDLTPTFPQVVRIAEGIKRALSEQEVVQRYDPAVLLTEEGRRLSLEARVERETFQRLIRDKVERTIECCHEALARARQRAGLRLGEIDHVILVGGSSRVPLVRATVRAAFCNPALPEHVRNHDPLLHEPDLCVAYGAALRAATHGTRYLLGGGSHQTLELHLTSPHHCREQNYLATGVVRNATSIEGDASVPPHPPVVGGSEGMSVRIRSLASGLIDEAFLDEQGSFAQEIELEPETENLQELTICDGLGRELAQVIVPVRQQSRGVGSLGQAVLPTQLITKPLQIEVLARGTRTRVKQVIAPLGATLPGTFQCRLHTTDQSGRVVVPIFEENRIIKEMIIEGLDPTLPVGSPVEVEAAIDARHEIRVRVCVRQGRHGEDLHETVTLSPPAPPGRPTRADLEACLSAIREHLGGLAGSARTRLMARTAQLEKDLLEALHYDDDPKAVQRLSELQDLRSRLESGEGIGYSLHPPFSEFTRLVRACLDRAAEVADQLGRSPAERQELFAYIHAQERYAEQAYEELNQTLYRECHDNLVRYGTYLEQLRDNLPGVSRSAPVLPPEEEARLRVDQFRSYLTRVWKKVREKQRQELDSRLGEIARQASGLNQGIKSDPIRVLRYVRKLTTEVGKVEEALEGPRPALGPEGLLEGTS